MTRTRPSVTPMRLAISATGLPAALITAIFSAFARTAESGLRYHSCCSGGSSAGLSVIGGGSGVVAAGCTTVREEEPSGSTTGKELARRVPGDVRWRGCGSLSVVRDLCDFAVLFDTVTPYTNYGTFLALLSSMSENTEELSILSPGQDKHVLFQHVTGPYAGLVAIMGRVSSLGLKPGQILPAEATGFVAQGRTIAFASLVKVTNRYVLYREPLQFGKPARGFDRSQR